MENLKEYIRNTDWNDVDEIFEIALEMKRIVHPEWEIVYFAFDKSDKEQQKKRIIEFIEAL